MLPIARARHKLSEWYEKLEATLLLHVYCELPEVVKGGGILRRVKMHQPEIVGNDPLEWVQVQSTLQACNRRHIQALRCHACGTRALFMH